MKALNSPDSNFDWGKDILNDLSFIKEHKRYPFTKRTIPPSVLLTVGFVVLARIAWPVFFGITTNSNFMVWLMTIVIAVMIIAVAVQYLQLLKFDAITSEQPLQNNISLLKRFMNDQHLAYTQHQDAPEVFLIISKNLNYNPKKEYREVMVFVADDKRILVNSHFVGSKFSITPPSGNYRKMAKSLNAWLLEQKAKNTKDIAVK